MKRILHTLLILALTALLLYLFFRNSDFSNVGEILGRATLPWLLLGATGNLLALVLRAFRWRLLLSPDDPPPFYPTFFSTVIGFMLSNILPVRASDVVRPALLARRTTIRFSAALGTVLTERILDLMAVMTLLVIFTATTGRSFFADPSMAKQAAIIKTTVIVAVSVLVGMSLLMVGVYFHSPFIRRLHEALSRFLPQRFRESWMHFFDSFVLSLEIAHHPAAMTKVVLCTAAIWLSLCSQFVFVLYAIHRPLHFTVSFFMTGMTILGLMVPTPGGVGGFHKVCQIILTSFYRFDVDTSVAAAILFHFVGVLPVIALGLILFMREGLSWRQVTHIAERVEEEGEPAVGSR